MIALACALAAPTAACFNDGGMSGTNYGLTGAGETNATDGTTGPGASSTTMDPSAGSDATNETTGSSTTVDVSTSSSSSSATDPDTSTGEPGDCPGECTPGQTELGAACAPCGTEERVCDDDCAWGEWSCVDPEACALWSLPADDNAWTPIRWDELANPDMAPSAPVEASFSANAPRLGFILTHDSFHVLDLDSLSWVDAGDRAELFPELAGATVSFAFSFNSGELEGDPPTPLENVSMHAEGIAWSYGGFDPIGYGANNVQSDPCCEDNDDWQVDEAPDPASVRGYWMDIVGGAPWVDAIPLTCGLEDPPAAYGVAVTEDTAHVQDIGQCFDFVLAGSWQDIEPLSRPGAPSSGARVGGAFYMHETIFLVGANQG